jgi:cytidylate kinase
MQALASLEKCRRFIHSEAVHIPQTRAPALDRAPLLAITISRQSGCGAHCVAEFLARVLQEQMPHDSPPWTVFDRNLVETVLAEHNLPPRLARFMPEDRIPELVDALDDLLGVHPPVWRLIEQTVNTVLRLAKLGNSIIIGRGAHIITSGLAHAFHVRLVGSISNRVAWIQQIRGVGKQAALTLIRQEDLGRRRYLKRYFGKEIDDPLSYHLVINTDSIPYESAARLIAESALKHVGAPSVIPGA